MRHLTRNLSLALVLLGLIAGGAWWIAHASERRPASFRTVAVKRGDLSVTINATGTLEPEEVVDVGAQVAGMIKEFGRDAGGNKTIDYGSHVEPDTVLAQIDDALYQEEVHLAQAQLAKAEAHYAQTQAQVNEALANVERAKADLVQMQAKLYQAQRDWERANKLIGSKTIVQEQYDATEAALQTARANVGVADAALAQSNSAVDTSKAADQQAKADINSAQATLKKAEKNLGYTTVRSPIAGVIVDRRVNIGQTVVSNFNAPSLFLIAKDLKRIQVWASVNEADIGQIHSSQKVHFTVDAYPNRVFQGVVTQVRLNATMTQNVVTYTVVVTADNSDNLLLPYLTANVAFEVDQRRDVLLVPNGALRWRPRPEQIAPAASAGTAENGSTETDRPTSADAPSAGTVWVREGEYVRPTAVRVGASDRTLTEVAGEGLRENSEVVIGENQPGSSDQSSDPFTPKLFNRSGKSS